MHTAAPTLRDRQIELERESTSLGIVRYAKAQTRADEADTGPGRRLVLAAVADTGAAIRAFVADADTGRPGKRHAAVKWLKEMDADACAYLTATICVNALTGKKAHVTGVARSVASALAQDINYKLLRDTHKGLYRVVQEQLKKSTSSDWEVVKAKMKHMVLVEGVKHIFLDHLTAFAAEADDEKKTLESITAQIARFVKINCVPNTNESTDTNVLTKYRANYADTVGAIFHRASVGTLQLLGLSVEDVYQGNKQGTLMLSKYALGHGELRADGAIELSKAA